MVILQECDRSPSNTSINEDLQTLCKRLLQNKLFVGNYQERRYVETLSAYRDVVIIHKSETDLKKSLDMAKERLEEIYQTLWFGFTVFDRDDPKSGHALWVMLTDLPFGHYWFQIKQIKFQQNEVLLKLKVIRSINLFDPIEEAECRAINPVNTSNNTSTTSKQTTTDWSDTIPTIEECTHNLGELRSNVNRSIKTHFTYENVRLVACFTGAFLVAAVTGFVHLVQFTGDFSLRFMREASIFIQAMTPIMLSVIDFITKLVGGFYILLAMMWRGKGQTKPGAGHANYRPAIGPPKVQPLRYEQR